MRPRLRLVDLISSDVCGLYDEHQLGKNSFHQLSYNAANSDHWHVVWRLQFTHYLAESGKSQSYG